MTTGITCTMAMVVLSAIMLVMPSAMAVEVAAPDALSAARDISEQTIYPGSTFAVTVTLSANEDVSAPVLDEDLPDSWTVTENNSAGAWYKEVTSEWFWLGAMSSGDSKTVVYDVTVPADAELQEYAITGAASAYGVDPIDVGGESTVTVIKELSATRDISEQTIFPGSTIRVTVTLTANEEVYAPALNEDIPDGWTIAEVDSAGAYYNEATSEWFWLDTMSSGDSKIVVYDVTVPASAVPQEYAITGAVSAYEVDLIDVRGEETVTVVKELSATRDISEQTAEPGSTFTVTVTLTANEEVYAPALNEDIPDGWTVTENNSAGAYYKESTSEWFWLGGMSSGDSKTVVYDVTVPVDAGPQEYVITGAVSAYDTDLIDVRGEETVTVVATGGGCYGSDGGSDDSDAAGSVPPGSEMSVTRDISSQRVGPGSSFTVTLTILANEAVDVVAPTLTENVSIGTIVVDPDSTLDLDDVSNGTLDVSDTWYNDSATMWILPERIPAGGSLTVEYSVTVPDDATPQEYSITGSASAYDVAAVEIGGEGEVTVAESVQSTMHINAGWNLVSIPVIPADASVDAIFGSNITPPIYEYDAGYKSVTSLEPTKGYWVLANSPIDIDITGIVPLDSEVTITIPPGWNLIGPVSPGVEVSSFTDITPPVYGYNAGYESATTLEQNRGYWVLANNETTLTMGGST